MNETDCVTAEWVLPGHPDRLCDALADRIVGEMLRMDALAQCSIEAACAFEHVILTGMIKCDGDLAGSIVSQVHDWVRETYRTAGYGGRWQPAPEALQIDTRALRIAAHDAKELRYLSDDQCICIGYAQDTAQTDYLPGASWTARRIAKALHARQQALPQGPIGPDGKVIVRGTEHEDGRFVPQSVSVSLHHAEDVDWLEMRRHAEAALRDALGSGPMPDLTVNAAGMFLCGGPLGDNGTTGKKLVLDAYGPGVPIGGGAWCGKDFHKPDRLGGLLARRLALQCVLAGLGRRVLVQLEYRPNSAGPESVMVWADGRPARLPPQIKPVANDKAAQAMIEALAQDGFTLLTSGQLARWGHLGLSGLWWEPRPGEGIGSP